MDHLQRFHEKYSKSGLLVFTIAVQPDVKSAQELTKTLGVTYPVFNGNKSDLAQKYAFG